MSSAVRYYALHNDKKATDLEKPIRLSIAGSKFIVNQQDNKFSLVKTNTRFVSKQSSTYSQFPMKTSSDAEILAIICYTNFGIGLI